MQRIIVIIVLSAAAVLSGCDKIKTELERRHLGAAVEKESVKTQKTLPVKQDDVKPHSKRKQIVFCIDLPANEKIQIRLIKNSVPEEEPKNDVGVPPKEDAKEAALPKEDGSLVKPDSPTDQEKKPLMDQSEAKDKASKSEIKSETEPKSDSDRKTEQEESLPPPPALAPTVVVPAREMTSPPELPDMLVKNSLASSKSPEPTPAEKAVGLALSVTPPEMNASPSNKALNAASATDKSTPSNPWAIPNADYPLRYY